jgi:NADPH:quinone reductase-like Zn-dependent oxidoreductase
MKAVTLVRKGEADKAFEMREHPMPELQANEVMIKSEGFGLNFAEVMARRGLYREAPPMPCVIGYELVGTVESVGANVDQSWVGKRVVGFTRFGGYAEYVATDERAVVEIPAEMPIGEAVALAVQYCTAWYCACEKMNLFKGDHVLIHAAAGGVGTALVQIAKWKGCTVYGTASNPKKLEYLKSIGVDYPINYREKDYVTEVKRLLGDKKKVDATFNAVGGKTFKKDMKLLGKGGTIVCFGAADRSGRKGGFFANLSLVFNMGFQHPLFLMMRSQAIVGVNMLAIADHKPDMINHCIKSVVKLTEEGVLKPHVGGEFHVDEIGKAHAFLEGRQSIGKIVVKW